MPFHVVRDGTSLWREVYDSECDIRIEQTTRDMPKLPMQVHVMVHRFGPSSIQL